jgi:hypothetical protein
MGANKFLRNLKADINNIQIRTGVATKNYNQLVN